MSESELLIKNLLVYLTAAVKHLLIQVAIVKNLSIQI